MKTKKCLLTLLILPFFYSCVVDKSYVLNKIPKEHIFDLIESNNLSFDFSVSHGDNKNLVISLWFKNDSKQLKIKNITFDIVPKDGSELSLETVEISSYINEKEIYNKQIKRKTFEQIPYEYRLTHFEGIGTQCIFNYVSNKKINSKYLKVSYKVILEDGSFLTDDFNLKFHKSSRFAVH